MCVVISDIVFLYMYVLYVVIIEFVLSIVCVYVCILYTLAWKNGSAECVEFKLRINQSINQSKLATHPLNSKSISPAACRCSTCN